MPIWLEKILIDLVMKNLTPELLAKIEGELKSFIVCELKALAAKTPTDIDDQVIARIAALLGVDCPVAPAPVAA